jgi:hypothetical protein
MTDEDKYLLKEDIRDKLVAELVPKIRALLGEENPLAKIDEIFANDVKSAN